MRWESRERRRGRIKTKQQKHSELANPSGVEKEGCTRWVPVAERENVCVNICVCLVLVNWGKSYFQNAAGKEADIFFCDSSVEKKKAISIP